MEKGSFVKINYIEKVDITGKVTDTNIESVAREAQILNTDDQFRYRPLPIIVGSGRPTKGVDEELLRMKVGEEKDFQVPPEKAYGPRDPKLLDMVPQSFFKKQGITPLRGLPVRTRRGFAIVRSTTGGRIRLDYNHPLAGQRINYHIEVTEEARDPETKLRWIIEMRLPNIDSESHIIEVEDGKARIELNTGDLTPEAVEQLRSMIKQDASRHVQEVTEVVFGSAEEVEEGETPISTEKEEKSDEEKSTEQQPLTTPGAGSKAPK